MQPEGAASDGGARYRCVGLVVHYGSSLNGGHYVAYCRHAKRPYDWYLYNDVRVQQVQEDEV